MISGSSRSSLLPQKWLIYLVWFACSWWWFGLLLWHMSNCLQPFIFRLGKVYRHHWDAHTGFIQIIHSNIADGCQIWISFGRFVEWGEEISRSWVSEQVCPREWNLGQSINLQLNFGDFGATCDKKWKLKIEEKNQDIFWIISSSLVVYVGGNTNGADGKVILFIFVA